MRRVRPSPPFRSPLLLLTLLATLGLSGCDMLGIESASAAAAKREAEGRAVGGACRHSARSIESCYALNKRADKAAVFAGWREMNDYMRENNIQAAADAEDGGDGASLAAAKPAAGESAGTEPAPAAAPAAKGKKADI
jgi:hypothetical protein